MIVVYNIVTLPRICMLLLYQPLIFFLRCWNDLNSNGFANISTVCSVVFIERIVIV